MRGDTWLATELAIGIISFLCCAFALDQTFLASLALAPRLVQWHLIGLVVTALAYRLSPLHPLYKYPGPRVAKCTSLYMTHVVWSGNRYKVYLELHRRYGDFVRIGEYKRISAVILFDLLCLRTKHYQHKPTRYYNACL